MKQEEIVIEKSEKHFRIVEETLKNGTIRYDVQYGLMVPSGDIHYYSGQDIHFKLSYETYDEALKAIEEYKQNQVVKRVATYFD